MTYNLGDKLDLERFWARAVSLQAKGSVVELTEKAYRTGSQNRYLHAIIGAVAMECGTTLDYAKEWYYKRTANADTFVTTVQDERIGSVSVLRSSADLSKEEMSLTIDRFKKWAAEQGIYLPEPGDEELLRQIEWQMGRMKKYL